MKTLLKLLFLGGIAASVVAIAMANLHQDLNLLPSQWKIRGEAPIEVQFSEVECGRIVHIVETPGKVEAEVEVKISAEVSGRIEKLPVREGDEIEPTQLLLQLDLVYFQSEVRSLDARVERLKASIRLNEVNVAKARRDLERNQRLYDDRAVELAKLDEARANFESEEARVAMSRAEHREAEASLAKAQEDLRKATIRAPIKGVVSQLSAKQGEVVLVGTMNNPGTVIMTVSDPNTLVVRARVDEAAVARVRPGQPVRVQLQGDQDLRLTGSVKRISPKGTKANGLPTAETSEKDVIIFETIITLDSPPEQVRMGMTVNVEIETEHRSSVPIIPAQAVLHRRTKDLPKDLVERLKEAAGASGPPEPARGHQVVYVAEGGKARCRLVKTGISDRNRVEILEGLRDGERVIVGPYRVFERLKHGSSVTELTEQAESKP